MVRTPAAWPRRRRRRTLPCSVNLKALESRFFSTCMQALRVGAECRPEHADPNVHVMNASLRASASWRKLRSMVSRSVANGESSLDSTVTVPDSIFDRSRMSLMRFSRSVPAPWMVLANSTCLA